MDAIVGLLEGIRARGAFLLRTVMDPPWSMRIEDEAALTVFSVVRGHAWVVVDGEAPVRLDAGDVAIARGPDHYTVADELATPPDVIVHPGQRCTTTRGQDLAMSMSLGVRTWGNSSGGATMLVTGTYEDQSEVSRRLLTALPTLLVVRSDEWRSPLVDLLADEITNDVPGQAAVLDRLLDLILVAVVRVWFDRGGRQAPTWWVAESDPVIGPALRLLYDDPARQWTIADLASAVGVSRASFARRFNDLIGEPPIAFLTGWRLALAADLLREADSTIGAVADRVGYGSPFALSTAFKRVYGISPHQHRSAARAAARSA